MKDFFNQKFLALVTTLGVFLTPIIPLLTIIGVLVIADFYTAYRIGKIKHNEPFSSKKFRITITKTGIYFSILIAARGIEMLYDYPIIVEITAALMIIAEARSLDEHYNTLTGKFLLKNLLDTLNSKVLNLKKPDGSN
jgi:hypothetical protein